ncbi:hypothetical protein [Cellulomonas composti]|uniref:Uncharacterized protein n=1 Tax=Cellulomonas composti TaxID=266130 RepID=A0A511JBI9_9CELL|nr:hypothetical protein [Cellulomonas composti]GEL95355.1 hypothetical protein CCO02nite_20130 [Cellulomonas composti]
MAGDPIKIIVDAETAGAESGLDQVADAFDDVSKASDKLDDATKDATKGLDKVEDGAQDAARQITRDLTPALKEAAQASEKVSRSSKDLGADMKRGTEEASEGMDDMKQNAMSNAKEMGGSFQDFNSVLDGLQGFIAEAAEGFGAMGIAAGVGAAAGIGLLAAGLQAAADKTAAIAEAASSLGAELSEATGTEKVDALADRWSEVTQQVTDAKSVWEVWQHQSVTGIQSLSRAASTGTLDLQGLFETFRDPDPMVRLEGLRRAQEGVSEALKEADKIRADGEIWMVNGNKLTTEQIHGLTESNALLKDEIATQEQALEIEQALADAKGQTLEKYRASQDAIESARSAQESYLAAVADAADPVSAYERLLSEKSAAEQENAQKLAAATDDQKDTWEDYARDAKVTMADLIADQNAQLTEQANFMADIGTLRARGLTDAMIDELVEKGPEVAGATADLLANSTDAELRRYAENDAALRGADITDGIATGMDDPATRARLNAQAQAVVSAALNQVVPPPVKVTFDPDGLTTSITRALADRTFLINLGVARPGQPAVT